MRTLLLALLWLLPLVSHAEEGPLLRVEIIDVESTPYSSDCVDDDDDRCIVWNLWYLYEARVKQVISGHFDAPTVTVAMYAHGKYNTGSFDDWYIVLNTFENERNAKILGTRYFMREPIQPETTVCLPKAHTEALDDENYFEHPSMKSEGRRCFDTQEFTDRSPLSDCFDSADEEDKPECLEKVVERARKELAETEMAILRKHEKHYDQDPWLEVRTDAFTAYGRMRTTFQEYQRSVCAFEATMAGNTEARRELELSCEYAMIRERIRLLYRQRELH